MGTDRFLFRRVLAAAAAVAALGTGLGPAPTARAEVYEANQIKAALVFNIVRFVSFPTSEPLRLCVARGNPTADALARLDGRRIGLAPLQVRELERGALFAGGCNVVYGGAEAADAHPRGVLVISDTAGFVDGGGIVGIERFGRQWRFAVNARAARRAGLSISSQLLRLATRVIL